MARTARHSLAAVAVSTALAGCSAGCSAGTDEVVLSAEPSAATSTSSKSGTGPSSGAQESAAPQSGAPQSAAQASEERADAPDPTDYVDGTYSADGQYGGPPSTIGVALTLADDVVTTIVVTPLATNPTSLSMQKQFAFAIAPEVVGRDIDDIHIDRFAGSSRTPDGFNEALEVIKATAER